MRFLICEAQVLGLSGNFFFSHLPPLANQKLFMPTLLCSFSFFQLPCVRAQNASHSLGYMCLGVFSNGMKFLFPQKQEKLGSLLVKPEIFHFSHLLSTFLSGRCLAFLSYIERLQNNCYVFMAFNTKFSLP